MALGAFVAVGALLIDVGDPVDVVDTMHNAQWGWILLAIVVAFAANVAYAVALQGTVRTRLPLGPTTELQVAMSFSNLAVPAIGGQGMQVRFLQKLGVDLPSAVAAGGVLSGFGALVAAFGCFAVALIVEPARVDLSLIPTNGLLLLLLVATALLVLFSALLAALPRLRARVVPPLSRATHTMAEALRSPGLLALLIGGNVVATIMSTWCLELCLIAFGGHVSFWALLAANVGVVTIASIVPVPGGSTAVGTVGLSAVLVSFGVPRRSRWRPSSPTSSSTTTCRRCPGGSRRARPRAPRVPLSGPIRLSLERQPAADVGAQLALGHLAAGGAGERVDHHQPLGEPLG